MMSFWSILIEYCLFLNNFSTIAYFLIYYMNTLNQFLFLKIMASQHVNYQFIMKTHVSSNSQYQQLLDTVGSFGKYQIGLLFINFWAFFLSGAYETALNLFFDIGDPKFNNLPKSHVMKLYCKAQNPMYYPNGIPSTIPFQFHFQCDDSEITKYRSLQNLSIACGLIISGYLSNKYGYKKILIGNSFLLLLGTSLLIIQNKIAMCLSLILINLPLYSTCCLFLCLIVEVIKEKYVPVLIVCMFSAKLLGNITIDVIWYAINNYRLLTQTVLIPLSALFIVSHWFYYESLRYLIDHDIVTGIAVLHQIAVTNKTQHQQLYLGNQFVINKIRLNKYRYKVLFSLISVRLLSCGFAVVMFALGFLSQAPLYILWEDLDGKSLSLIVSVASLLGTIPTYIYSAVAKRKQATQICCGIILSILVAITVLCRHPPMVPLPIRILFVLILSLVLTTLTSFIVISLVESYPHTVRTLAYCLFVAMEFIGRFSCVMMRYSVNNIMTQYIMYIEALIVILIYMVFLKETKYKNLEYELKELNEVQIKGGQQIFC